MLIKYSFRQESFEPLSRSVWDKGFFNINPHKHCPYLLSLTKQQGLNYSFNDDSATPKLKNYIKKVLQTIILEERSSQPQTVEGIISYLDTIFLQQKTLRLKNT